MISCQIGLISFSKKYPNLGLILGIVRTKKYRELSIIDEATDLFTSFRVTFKNGKITISNFEDIKQFWNLHNISENVYFTNNKITHDFSLIFNKPILYDISCMVSLFNKISIKNEILETKQGKNIYLLILNNNMLERNKIIKNCLESLNGVGHTFMLLSSFYVNKKAKWYLRENGIRKKNILEIPIINNNLQEQLSEAFYILNFLKVNSENSKFYIGLCSNKMNDVLKHKKALEFINKEVLVFNFICE